MMSRYSIFRWMNARDSDGQSGRGVSLDEDTVMDYHEAEDSFTEVEVRRMTYLEAALAQNPDPNQFPPGIIAFGNSTLSHRDVPVSNHVFVEPPKPEPHASYSVMANLEYQGEDIALGVQKRKKR